MNKICRRSVFSFVGVFAALMFAAPGDAKAFCVANASKVKIHAQSLSTEGFKGEVDPKMHLCCADKKCVSPKTKRVQVLVVTGYVPVTKKKGRPGWKAECRAKVKMDEWVEVKGALNKITCKTRKSIPKGWQKK